MEAAIQKQWADLHRELDERGRRRWAATEARKLGWGGVSAVSRATGMARSTIHQGMRELDEESEDSGFRPARRVRRKGGGRKRVEDLQPDILVGLEALLEPDVRGEPDSPLRWTCKSLRQLVCELAAQGYQVSRTKVSRLLGVLGYSLQANSKVREGTSHPDRNEQFEYIHEATVEQLKAGNPTISVDTKKKELVGEFKNGGREWRPEGRPEKVSVHDFADDELGKAAPYGVYDVGRNEGWVSVGVSHDTASFAVESIRRWWTNMGRERYPRADNLLITADCGGSNGYRLRLWKWELQQLADELGFPITVSHLPPGTSKWNKIEHRLFSFITMNWRGRPLRSLQTIVSLIGNTTTTKGLVVRSELDSTEYVKGRKVTDGEMATIKLHPYNFHGECIRVWLGRIDEECRSVVRM